MPYAAAQAIYNALLTSANGNNMIAQGLALLANLNILNLLSLQNNQAGIIVIVIHKLLYCNYWKYLIRFHLYIAKNYWTVFHKSCQSQFGSYTALYQAQLKGATAFTSQNSSSVFTANLNDLYQSIKDVSNVGVTQFIALTNSGAGLKDALTNLFA